MMKQSRVQGGGGGQREHLSSSWVKIKDNNFKETKEESE